MTDAGHQHLLWIEHVDSYGPSFSLQCIHPKRIERWATVDEDGNIESRDCWLTSWWESIGAELLDLRNIKHFQWPIPVKPSDDWDADNGGAIVVDRGER